MRYWLDTEYEATSGTLGLISVGVVSEDGRGFYAEVAGARYWVADPWVRENVLPYLRGGDAEMTGGDVDDAVVQFVGDDPSPEFWTWCGGFDYAVMCASIGMDNWPRHWPYFFNDVAQSARERGIVLPDQPEGVHDALADALWVKHLWETMYA